MTADQQASYLAQLEELDAPKQVMDAARRIMASLAAKVRPAADLIEYVTAWVGRNNQQNRFGK